MANVTSKYEVELDVDEQQALNNGEAVTIELPDAKVDLTAADGAALTSGGPDPSTRDHQADEEVGIDDLKQEVAKASDEDAPAELEGGSGGDPNAGMIRKNPDG